MSVRFSRLLVLALLPISAIAQYPGAVPAPANAKKGFESVTAEDTKKWLGYLAGPECMGRGSGQPGYQKAADYVAERFKELGLKPGGENGTYFQQVPFIRRRYDPATTRFVLPDGDFKAAVEKDFVVNGRGADIDISAPIVFLRAKGDPKETNVASVKGKIAVLYIEDGFLRKALLPSVLGQAAFTFLVVDKVGSQPWFAINASNALTGLTAPTRPARQGYVTLAAARALAGELRIPKGFWERSLASGQVMEAGSERQVKLSGKSIAENIGVPNVIGVLEGSDPALKQEFVAAGAHLDHLGTDGNITWWGADDNGSGSAALIGTVKAFANNPVKPKRSVAFIAFCGEELGLIGSEYFVTNPTLPLDKLQCYLNMDMVGRASVGPQLGRQVDVQKENRTTMRLISSKKTSLELDRIIRDANRSVGFKFNEGTNDAFGGSDHVHFDIKGIPVGMLFCGQTPDYHNPTDTIEKVDFAKLTNASKLTYLSLMRVANLDHALKRDKRG